MIGCMDAQTEPFDGDRCWATLATGSLGRVALSMAAMPVVVPVRYTVEGGALRVKPPKMARIDKALSGSIVAFQADGIDPEASRAWSIHAIGRVESADSPGADPNGRTFEIRPLLIEGDWLVFD
ncbi:MAG: pyridoxamine 5'-phosphate oxidase family protein [Acidimicrobiales bacterium]